MLLLLLACAPEAPLDTAPATDLDGDGWSEADGDCDDDDPAVRPGAIDRCDGVDADCDGTEDGLADFEDAAGGRSDLSEALTSADGEVVTWALDEPGTLRLCGGEWPLNLEITADEVSILGVDGPTLVGGGPVVRAVGATLEIADLTLSGGAASYGGGLYVEDGAASLSDVQLEANAAAVNGGGIYCLRCELTIAGGALSGNSAGYFYGGGVYADGGRLTLSEVRFEGNEANFGGGLDLYDSEASIVGGGFRGNTAESYGGAIGVYLSELQVEGADFNDNAPHDVYHVTSAEGSDWGEDADLTCDETGCR